jgi:hypothetical protein
MTFPLMKSASITMFSHRQNANKAEKEEPKYDEIPDHLGAFYEKAVGELQNRGGKSGTEVTNDLAGHIEGGMVTPMAIMAIMNPKTGKYEVMTHDIITPADAAELEQARQLFMAPKPKRKKRGSASGGEADPPETPPETPPAAPPKKDPKPAVAKPPKTEKPPAEKPEPAAEPAAEEPPAEKPGATKMTEMLQADGKEEEEEDLDDVLNAAAEEPKSEAAAELEAATEARAAAEDDEEDPDLAAIFGDD